jgi:hypothetical protein
MIQHVFHQTCDESKEEPDYDVLDDAYSAAIDKLATTFPPETAKWEQQSHGLIARIRLRF